MGVMLSDDRGDTSSSNEIQIRSELNTDSKCLYYPYVNSIWLHTDSQCTRITPSDISYVGMIYYEEKRVGDLVTFAASKHLNALLEVN